MSSMTIRPGVPERFADGRLKLSCEIGTPGSSRQLWFEAAMSQAFEAPREPNWAVVALLYPAMEQGLDIRIEAPLSAQLLSLLNHDLQALLRAYDPGLRAIRVQAPAAAAPESVPHGVATGYSAGIDTFATLMHHQDGAQPGFSITHLACFNVGTFGRPGPRNDPDLLYGHARARAVDFAKHRGYSWMTLDSNLDSFYRTDRKYGSTHTLRSAAAALFFEESIGTYLFSSTVTTGEFTVDAGLNMSRLEPVLLPMLSSARCRFHPTLGFLDRVAKTERVSRCADSHARLDVCVGTSVRRTARGTINCTQCWKCARTTLTLECLGSLDCYREVFDLDLFHRTRRKLLYAVARRAYGGSTVDQQVLDLLKKHGQRVPGRLQTRWGPRL